MELTWENKVLADAQSHLERMTKGELLALAKKCKVTLLKRQTAAQIRTTLRNIHGHSIIADMASAPRNS